MTRKMLLILGLFICLSACSLAPKYTRPKAPIPDKWPQGDVYKKAGVHPGTSTAVELRWDKFFIHKNLQEIIKTALSNNRDLRLAALNVEKARALYGVQRAELYPVVDATASRSKQHMPDIYGFGRGLTLKQYRVDMGISSWEIDFFGRIRSLKKKALEEYFATDQARRSAQISLISEVARVYLTLAADRENLKLSQSTLKTQQGIYNLIRRQYKVGVANELDLSRAQTQVDTARGDVAYYMRLVAQDQNALNLLAGSPVPENLLPADLKSITPPKDISPGLSSKVLLRRPDIMEAEHRLKAAYAYIGAARAAFFPRISLTTSVGTASDELSGLFSPGSKAWQFVSQVAMPIFDARTWAAYRVSKAERKIALTQYEKTIQVAFREVADTLAVRGTVDEQLAAEQSLVDALAKTYRLSTERYHNGIDSYLSVLDAQRSRYAAQQRLTSLYLARLANQVSLYAVLGGGGE